MAQMAEGVSNVLCRYFVHGVCREGDNCLFSHDLKAKPSMTCKYYKLGCCSYGSQCRYDHVRDSKESAATHSSDAAESLAGKSALVSPVNVMTPLASMTASLHQVNGEQLCSDVPPSPTPLSLTVQAAEQWVQAPEFVPGQLWMTRDTGAYEQTYDGQYYYDDTTQNVPSLQAGVAELCPYMANGACPYGDQCVYVHGDVCDLCNCAVLSPFDEQQRLQHTEECLKLLQEDMDLSFAVQRSEDKVCGICMEVVWQKQPTTAQRFGILSSCCHIYCLDCIRKWRSAKQFENVVVRSCPECRIKSDFVTPSKYWVEDSEEKDRLIAAYKQSLCKKRCKYFDEGRGECPFGNHCFYLHAYPDGRKASPRPTRRRFRHNADGEVTVLRAVRLWDFVDEMQERRQTRRRHGADDDDTDDDEDWRSFFIRLQELGFELPSDDDDDDSSDAASTTATAS